MGRPVPVANPASKASSIAGTISGCMHLVMVVESSLLGKGIANMAPSRACHFGWSVSCDGGGWARAAAGAGEAVADQIGTVDMIGL